MIKITIPNWKPTSLNKLMRMHWGQRSKIIKGDKELIAHYSKDMPKATTKRRVSLHIVLGKGSRQIDHDNLLKSLVDGLVSSGMLLDDRPDCMAIGDIAYSRGERDETIITLEDLWA